MGLTRCYKTAVFLHFIEIKRLEVSHHECDLHQKLIVSKAVCKECLLQILQRFTA